MRGQQKVPRLEVHRRLHHANARVFLFLFLLPLELFGELFGEPFFGIRVPFEDVAVHFFARQLGHVEAAGPTTQVGVVVGALDAVPPARLETHLGRDGRGHEGAVVDEGGHLSGRNLACCVHLGELNFHPGFLATLHGLKLGRRHVLLLGLLPPSFNLHAGVPGPRFLLDDQRCPLLFLQILAPFLNLPARFPGPRVLLNRQCCADLLLVVVLFDLGTFAFQSAR
mmetsp:Transcript_28538/g.63705  ORF Transcript_28538/g.63705 Transcript_28538/m.63705 type:complete len:225 (+) Transcript_28538:1737-2411(+)